MRITDFSFYFILLLPVGAVLVTGWFMYDLIKETEKAVLTSLQNFQKYYYETEKKKNRNVEPPKKVHNPIVLPKKEKGKIYSPSKDVHKTMGDGQEELFD